MVKSLKNILVLDTETTGLDTHKDKLLGISMYDGVSSSYGDCIPDQEIVSNSFVVAHNGKFDAEILKNNASLDVQIDFDTQIAYYMLHIDRPKKLEKICKDLFNVEKEDLVEVYNKATGKNRKSLPADFYDHIPVEQLGKYAQEDVEYTYKIFQYCQEKLEENSTLKEWFYNVEMPLCNILIKSEMKGAKINIPKLRDLQSKLNTALECIEAKLKLMANYQDLNLNSSKQLQEVMYKNLKLPKLKKTKTGWSTNTATLEKLAKNHAFPKLLLQYREYTKLMNSFVEPLQERADENGRVHASFNQMGTKTRRMSCSNPNLQQIPSKSEVGQEVRKCFVPENGKLFLISDYSQIELRLLAHFSGEPKLIKAFSEGADVHEQTANYIANRLGKEFTRRQGKILNFSIVYGKTAFGFAEDWSVSREEAQEILDAYLDYYPKVKEFIYKQQMECLAKNGWIKTISGLPLYIDNINSNDKWKFEEAKRQAVNYLIQGSSQDVLKQAIVNIYNKHELVPCLMVHDELVYEVDKSYDLSNNFVVEEMVNALTVSVKLEVDSKLSNYWEK